MCKLTPHLRAGLKLAGAVHCGMKRLVVGLPCALQVRAPLLSGTPPAVRTIKHVSRCCHVATEGPVVLL